MWFSGGCNRMRTYPSTTVALMSHNKINGWTEDKEDINGRESMKRGKEWINRKESERLDESWYYCLLEITVSQ